MPPFDRSRQIEIFLYRACRTKKLLPHTRLNLKPTRNRAHTRPASLDEATKYAQRRANEEANQQTRVFGKPLESVLNDLASVLVLFQNPVEFFDVGRFWKVVVETGLFEYCLVRPGSIAGNGD
jgi:hypothetical protein